MPYFGLLLRKSKIHNIATSTFLMIFNPKYHICIIFQVKVEQNTFEIIEIVSQMNIKMA